MKKLIAAAFFLGIIYMFYSFFLRQGNISKIYQHVEHNERTGRECKSTVVLVDNAPLSQFSLKKMWLHNSEEIIKKWSPLDSDCDEILFVNNKKSPPNYRSDLKYWVGDNHICLNNSLGNHQCLSKEEQLFILQLRTSTLDDERVGSVNEKSIYLHFIDY